jgi:hypothetical protein
MRSLRRSLLLVAAGLVLGAPAADAATRVVGVAGPANDRDVTRLGGWVVRTQAQSTLARATASMGRPTRCTSRAPGLASASWRPVGLRGSFYTLDSPPGVPACRAPGRLYAGSVTLTGDWATSKGLRIGDPLAQVLALYPKAASVRTLYPGFAFPAGRWQLEYKVFFGDRSPLLMAVMRSGKVVAFEASLGRGGE